MHPYNPIRNISSLIIILTAVTLFGFPLSAEKIILKDGRTVEGKIISRTANEIQIQTSDGFITLIKNDIDKITDEDMVEEKNKKEISDEKDTMGDVLENFRKKGKAEEIQTEKSTALPPPVVYPDLGTAMLRSAIYPGFGQYSQDRYWQGAAFTAAFTGSLFWYTSNLFQSDLYRQKYRDQGTELRTVMLSGMAAPNSTVLLYQLTKVIKAKDEYRKTVHHLNDSAYLMLGIYFVNELDVYLFHPRPGISVGLHNYNDNLGLSLNFRF
jgi:hypothetical protein